MKRIRNVIVKKAFKVSLCVREWIETQNVAIIIDTWEVSLCVREWIET